MASIARLFFALAILSGLGGLARADESAADQQAIHNAIAGQIDAFRHDDGAAAYGYASPTIKSLYPNADVFMQMVKQGYPPVYRPQSVTFGPIADGPTGPMQKVFITGPDGKDYVALYALQKQPDGSWLINGCQLLQADSPSI